MKRIELYVDGGLVYYKEPADAPPQPLIGRRYRDKAGYEFIAQEDGMLVLIAGPDNIRTLITGHLFPYSPDDGVNDHTLVPE